MKKNFQMSIFDINGKKLCSLYDSCVEQVGSAQAIKIKKEINGWKEISFNLSKYDQQGNYNYRCDFIKNEQLLDVTEGDVHDIYCIKIPSALHDKSKIQFTVSCNHISEELKTKNLYKYFDDENGIGTCEELITKAIRGSGWRLVACDKFIESDGTTEKIRSFSCETKTGAYNMISQICDLFEARPIYHGADRTIEIRAITNTAGWMEILFGKNMDKIKRSPNSDNIVTRLYVEGEQGDYGYVGIDNVNPTGLPFILNFDYYKEIGMFTDAHQEMVDKYLVEYKNASDAIKAVSTQLLEQYAELTTLLGNYGYTYYPVIENEIDFDNPIYGNGIAKNDRELISGDMIYAVSANGSYTVVEYKSTMPTSGLICVIKFVPAITGSLAAYEDTIEASNRAIDSYIEKINYYLNREGYAETTLEELKAIQGTDDLSIVNNSDFDLSGVEEQYKTSNILEYAVSIGEEEKSIAEWTTRRNDGMLEAIALIKSIDTLNQNMDSATATQEDVEDEFSSEMGTLLKDGYWSDLNQTVGQEQSLYNDAIEISKKMAFPTITYAIDIQNLAVLEKYRGEDFELAQTIRIYDPELRINDYGIVSETTIYPDKPISDSIAIKTDLLDIGAKSFATILERVTSLAEQVRQNRGKYERAAIISKDGTIKSDALEGAIDVMKTQILSNSSNWKTDENGNIIFTTLDGRCAMMLCGTGFMIANSKTESGNWNWRTFGTGDGFTADLITTGYLSAARIDTDELIAKEGFIDTITTSVIQSPGLGENIDISKNSSIELTNEKIELIVSSESTETKLVLTDQMTSLITKQIEIDADNIDLSANESVNTIVKNEVEEGMASVEMTQDKFETFVQNSEGIAKLEMTQEKFETFVEGSESIAKLEMTQDKFETFVEGSEGISAISQKADEIDILIEDGSTSTDVKLTSGAINAISQNINLQANEEFNVTIGDLETSISANTSGITLATSKAEAAQTKANSASTAASNAQSTANAAQRTADAALPVVDFQRVVRIDEYGLHVGDNQSSAEVLIDSESVNVVMGGQKYSQFTGDYVQFGLYQLRESADGGLVFKIKET